MNLQYFTNYINLQFFYYLLIIYQILFFRFIEIYCIFIIFWCFYSTLFVFSLQLSLSLCLYFSPSLTHTFSFSLSLSSSYSHLCQIMKERHSVELRDYQRLLMGKQTRPKFSKDLLNLRKIQDTLAKQKECVS